MQRFDNRRVIVSGAGSGIGAPTVARLLDEGGMVMAFDVNEQGLAATAAAADDADNAKRLSTAVVDVSSEEAVTRAVAETVAKFDGLECSGPSKLPFSTALTEVFWVIPARSRR